MLRINRKGKKMAEEQKDSETKERLLSCAKKEFAAKGYAKASLRAICREAGVTTGALYFFHKRDGLGSSESSSFFISPHFHILDV